MGVDRASYRPRPEAETREVLSRYGIPTGLPGLLYVGTEHPRKNLTGLFRAFARLQSQTDAMLIKVGAPRAPQHAELERLASSLGIAGRVMSVESVSESDMPALYAAAHVLVLPSFYEGFGLPPLEAMACGTPVAVSRATSLPELVGDAGLYFDPRDERDLADALLRLLRSEDLRVELGTRGLERAKAYGWERTIEGLVRSYERLGGT
jgi:alpha-1,3-rhamnosyl/mannosyltransferase